MPPLPSTCMPCLALPCLYSKLRPCSDLVVGNIIYHEAVSVTKHAVSSVHRTLPDRMADVSPQEKLQRKTSTDTVSTNNGISTRHGWSQHPRATSWARTQPRARSSVDFACCSASRLEIENVDVDSKNERDTDFPGNCGKGWGFLAWTRPMLAGLPAR